MPYYIDLSKITIDDYKIKLASCHLPPSRMILKENLDERMNYFKQKGIENVEALIKFLKQKDNQVILAQEGLFSEEYLTILLRELNSIHPKPTRLSDFAGIKKEILDNLAASGIKNTQKLYEKVITKEDREKLALTTGISEDELLEVTKLADLSRIKYAGATFARMLYELGYDTVVKAAQADPEKLHEQVNAMNKEKQIYKAQIGLNDIKIFVEAAKEVPVEVEY